MKEIMEKYKEQFKEAWRQLKSPGERKKQIPNILTATRLLAPFVIIPSVATGNFIIAGIGTLLFSATDMVDGFLARKMKSTSDLGKDLDAVTDKVFIGTLLTSLLLVNPIYGIPLILEGTIAGINTYKKIKNKNPESHMIGKIKMTSLYVLVALGFINMYISIPLSFINLLYASTLGFQVLTICNYVKKDTKEMENKKELAEECSLKEIDDKEKISIKEKTKREERLEKYKFYKYLLYDQMELEKSQEKQELEEDSTKIFQLKNQNSNKK